MSPTSSSTQTCLLLILLINTWVECIEYSQPSFVTIRPGESLSVTCKVTGGSITNSGSIWASVWIRQPSGKGLEWINLIWHDGSTTHKESLKSKFSISRDTSSNTITLQGQNMQPEDTAVYYCAQELFSGYFDYWGKGTQVTVSSAQASVPTSLFPLSQCGSDSGYVTLGCVTAEFLPANSVTFKWKDASGSELSDFIQYPDFQVNGKYSKVSQIKIKDSDWEAKKSYTCEVEYPNGNKKATLIKPTLIKPEEILHSPLMYLMKPTTEEMTNNLTATFACLAAEFSPPDHKFMWMKEVGEIETELNGSYSFTSSGGGNHSATSYLQVPEDTWRNPGTKITCMFKHKTGNHTLSVMDSGDLDDCDAGSESKPKPIVEILPPSTEDMLVHKEGWIKCVITNEINTIDKDAIEWRRNGKRTVWKRDQNGNLKTENNKITIQLSVKYEEWQNGTEFSCHVPSTALPAAISKSYRRENGGEYIKPSVFLMPPPEHEQSGTVTLTCFAKEFFPKEVFVSWLANDDPVDAEYSQKMTSVIESSNGDKGTYSVYSQLTFDKDKWEAGKVFSCVVYHESAKATVRMISRSIDRVSQKPTTVSVSMGAMGTCK